MPISSLSRTLAYSLGMIPWAFFGCGGSDVKPAPAPTAGVPGASATELPVTTSQPESGSSLRKMDKSLLETDKEDMDGNN